MHIFCFHGLSLKNEDLGDVVHLIAIIKNDGLNNYQNILPRQANRHSIRLLLFVILLEGATHVLMV